MSRLFEAAVQTASYAKFRPQPPQAIITRLIDYVKEELITDQLSKLDVAVDVGCGSGQCTKLLAAHFHKVCGFDISGNQIKHAKESNLHNNVCYSVGDEAKLPINDKSVDLVTCAQSFHWLDTKTFYPELNRILKVNGVVALITYEMPFLNLSKTHLLNNGNMDKSDNIKLLIRNFYGHSKLKPFWASKERYLVDTAYESVVLPFPNQVRFKDTLVNDSISASDIVGYINSWSGFNSLKENNSEKAMELIDEFNESAKIICSDLNSNCYSVEFPFHLIMAKKN